MSVRNRFRVLVLCAALQMGVLSGVPMLPDEIRALMQQLNKPVLANVLPAEDDDAGRAEPIDVTGEWRVKGSFDAASIARGSARTFDLICTFDAHAGVLTGSCAPPGAPEGAAVSGSVHDRDVEWQ